jgi:hypothetical protein
MDRKQVLPFQHWQYINYYVYIIKTLLPGFGHARRRRVIKGRRKMRRKRQTRVRF